MKQKFTASIWQEGEVYVSQCNEIDIASFGSTKKEALEKLAEAIELHFEEPVATMVPEIYQIEAEVYAS